MEVLLVFEKSVLWSWWPIWDTETQTWYLTISYIDYVSGDDGIAGIVCYALDAPYDVEVTSSGSQTFVPRASIPDTCFPFRHVLYCGISDESLPLYSVIAVKFDILSDDAPAGGYSFTQCDPFFTPPSGWVDFRL